MKVSNFNFIWSIKDMIFHLVRVVTVPSAYQSSKFADHCTYFEGFGGILRQQKSYLRFSYLCHVSSPQQYADTEKK